MTLKSQTSTRSISMTLSRARRYFATTSSSCSPPPPSFSFVPNHPSIHHVRTPSRSVVGSFLIKFPRASSRRAAAAFPLVALFRRSAKVKAFPLKLGLVSGSIEASDKTPYEAAVRELQEETGLEPGVSPGLEFFARGKPYSVYHQDDPEEFTAIHPFAFLMTSYTESKIKLNWENDSWQWYTAEEIVHIAEDEGVVNLLKSLRRVLVDVHVGTGLGTVVRLAIISCQERAMARRMEQSQSPQAEEEEEVIHLIVGTYITIIKGLDRGRETARDVRQWWNKLRWVGVHLEMNANLSPAMQEVLLRTLEIIQRHCHDKVFEEALVKDLETYQRVRILNANHLRLWGETEKLQLKNVIYADLESEDT